MADGDALRLSKFDFLYLSDEIITPTPCHLVRLPPTFFSAALIGPHLRSTLSIQPLV